MSVPSVSSVPPNRFRKHDALAFIVDYIIRRRTSPSLDEISTALDVSKVRVRALLAQLAADGAIERPTGTQRAIVVPGLLPRIALDELRRAGWRIDEDVRSARFTHPAEPLPQEHLSLVAIIEHVPDHAPGQAALPANPRRPSR